MNLDEMPKEAILPFLPAPTQLLKLTHRHCSLCRPPLTREHPLGRYHLTFEQLWWSMYHRATVVLREFHHSHNELPSLEVDALKLNVTYQRNEWLFHNLGAMTDTRERDDVMRALSRGDESFTTRIKKGGGGAQPAASSAGKRKMISDPRDVLKSLKGLGFNT